MGYQRLVAVNHNFSALGSVRERDNSTQRFSEGMTGERNRRYGIVNVAISKVMYRTVVDTPVSYTHLTLPTTPYV